MLFDFNTQHDQLKASYDYCVCGAGAAGITMALELAATGKKVALLEAGGVDYSEESQKLYETEVKGYWEDYPIAGTRLRFLGGTTNHWSGRCRPFDRHDFERTYDAGLPGWPIPFEEMNNYLSRAMLILDMDPEKGFPKANDDVLRSAAFKPDFYQTSAPTRFKTKYQSVLESTENLDVFVNANVTNIALTENLNAVSHIDMKNYQGHTATLKVQHLIIAMGAVENARILLCSNRQQKRGVGNQHNMVGRCFMEHFNAQMGEFIPTPEKWQNTDRREFYPQEDYLNQKKIGGGNLTLNILGQAGSVHGGRLKFIKEWLQEISCKYDLSDNLQFLFHHQCGGTGVITSLIEQSPNKQSRIELTDELDAIGMRKVRFNCQMSDFDKHTIRTLAKQIAKDIADAGLGRVKLPSYILEEDERIVSWPHAHHIGTTRMAASPEHGVVDQNCQVFGVDNLHVAGASVFSTGGGTNPTMPLIQLALRLSDHLKALPA